MGGRGSHKNNTSSPENPPQLPLVPRAGLGCVVWGSWSRVIQLLRPPAQQPTAVKLRAWRGEQEGGQGAGTRGSSFPAEINMTVDPKEN